MSKQRSKETEKQRNRETEKQETAKQKSRKWCRKESNNDSRTEMSKKKAKKQRSKQPCMYVCISHTAPFLYLRRESKDFIEIFDQNKRVRQHQRLVHLSDLQSTL